ncbi:heterokaryon incompatibility protein-domain-containing protein [Xylaria arbuscula]|nr:heterokaryon incompatibility protein-domain-containing protein [Xylaria arbuscula]
MESSESTTNLCENCEDADLEAVFRIFAPSKFGRRRRDNDPGPTFDAVRRKSTPQVDWQWSTPWGTCALCSMLKQLKLLKQLDSPQYPRSDEVCLIQVRPGAPLVTLGLREKPSNGSRNLGGDWCFTNVEGKWGLNPRFRGGEDSFWSTNMIMDPIINCYEQISSLIKSDMSGQAEMVLGDMDTLATIDSHSMRIVDKPAHEEYLTLSYVWGSGSDNVAFGVRIPKTIQDAITATKRLGYRYLWVDRYCIDQKSEKRKQAQIRQMDRIYSNASLCLVAAAGDSPNHGLPGVSEPRPVLRKKPFCSIGGTTLYFAHEALDMWSLVEGSKWASRGWTFQELLFSKRLVFFTKKGLMLKISEDWYPEWDFTKHGFTWNSMERVYWPPPSEDRPNFAKLLNEYTVRDMTLPTDILNGFAGVLNRYTSLDKQMGCFCGIFYHEARPLVFLRGIRWTMRTLAYESYVSIRGHSFSRLERRVGFPSWSWCGWYGQTSTYHLDLHNADETNQEDSNLRQPEILVELRDGSRVSVPQAGEQSFNNPRIAETSCLILSTWFVGLGPWEGPDPYNKTGSAGLPPPIDAEGRYRPSNYQSGILPCVWDQAKQGNQVECVGLVLDLNSSYVVPLMRKGKHWERCGVEDIEILFYGRDKWSTILREEATGTKRQEHETSWYLSGLKLKWGQFKIG